MSRSEFDDFVRRQQSEEQKEDASFDPKQQLAEWLAYLDALYKQITGFLETYVESGAAQIGYREIILNEDFIGDYRAKEMLLKIGRATVIFTPVGTMLVAMKGRVEVQGPSGRATLFLVNKLATSARSLIRVQVTIVRPGDPPPTPPQPSAEAIKQIEWEWKIATPPPEMRFIDLTQDVFFNMILSVANA